jgi:hypothetical protein
VSGEPTKAIVHSLRRKISMYWGPVKFRTSPWHWDQPFMEKRAATFNDAFPKLFRLRASARVVANTSIGLGREECRSYCAEVVIPRSCRVAAIFEDLDYTAPIWLNLLALLFFVWVLA